jgi:hypothetical protein
LIAAAAAAADSGPLHSAKSHGGLGVGWQGGTAVLSAVGSAMLTVVVVGLFRNRRRIRGGGDELLERVTPHRWSWWYKVLAAIVALSAFVGVGLAIWNLIPSDPTPRPVSGLTPNLKFVPTPGGAGSTSAWWAALGVVIGVAVVLISLRRASKQGQVGPPEPEPTDFEAGPSPAVLVAAVLDRLLADLEQVRDPRQAIVAAYWLMDRLLAERGMGRQRWETPVEWLDRALDQIGMVPEAARGLSGLFQLAVFSQRLLGEPERQAALNYLRAVSGRAVPC